MDLPTANSGGSRLALTAGLIPGGLLRLVTLGTFFCKSRHVQNLLIIFEFFSSLLCQASDIIYEFVIYWVNDLKNVLLIAFCLIVIVSLIILCLKFIPTDFVLLRS